MVSATLILNFYPINTVKPCLSERGDHNTEKAPLGEALTKIFFRLNYNTKER